MEQASRIENLQVLLIGTIGMMILTGFIILFIVLYQKRRLIEQEERRMLLEANQERVLEAILETQENERRRIARDLHDEIGSYLSVAKMTIGHLAKSVKTGEDGEAVEETYAILDDTLKNVRRISKDLHPVVLEKYGLLGAVEAFGKKCSAEDLDVQIVSQGNIGRLADKQELNIFRIVQELLSNALKHARASEVQLNLDAEPGRLIMSYKDNGVGFKLPDSGKAEVAGIGMITIDTRVRMLKGAWKLESEPGKGTTASFSFPLIAKK